MNYNSVRKSLRLLLSLIIFISFNAISATNPNSPLTPAATITCEQQCANTTSTNTPALDTHSRLQMQKNCTDQCAANQNKK